MTGRLTQRNTALTLTAALLAAGLGLTGCGEESSQSPTDPAGDGPANAETIDVVEPVVPEVPEPPAPDNPRTAEGVTVKDGYQVELLYKTDKPNQGSWVALCNGPDGTLYATDQYTVEGQALYQIKPAAIGDFDAETEVTAHPVELNGAQGLYYGFGALYVMESGGGKGLTRVTDSDGDGLLDKKELVLAVHGGGEHGTHAIVPTPDGKALYIIAGNMTKVPEVLAANRPARLWDEDQLLKREPDARGHASSVMAPGGWICRVDPDGSNLTLHCAGFRNAYDMDVHPNGELFAYDSDMEWDIGQPWYRPTRVNHAVSGAEFGWRNGSGKWPTYFEDSLPAVTEIGPGSPVGVTFGTGANFPTKYQSALFILDWTYGTIYAVHLSPDGASYTGELEPFVYGKPLPLTDATVGADGALYFTVGGRRGDSALYRVTYYGNKDKTTPTVAPLNDLAKLRRQLETLHAPNAGADQLDLIWSNLDHSDRHIRFAARVGLEHLSPDTYLAKAKAEKDAMTRNAAGLALARHKHADALDVLMGVELETGKNTLNLAWMRAVGVALARSGAPDSISDQILAKLAKLADTDNENTKVEIIRLRIFLNDPSVVDYALAYMNQTKSAEPPAWLNLAAKNDRYGEAIIAMRDNPPPVSQFNVAFMLRNMKDGWTPTTRAAYFSWLNRAALGGGGNSYKGYIAKVRDQAIATLTEKEKIALGPLLTPPDISTLPPLVEPKGPGRTWTVEQAVKLVDGNLKKRSYDNGAGLYVAALCSQCHRVGDIGGDIGPDLTTAANKFTIEDFMRATIEPNHEISEQYAMTEIVTKGGETIVGRVIEQTDEAVKVKPDPRNDETVTVTRDQIDSIKISEVSTMPVGLVNPMSANELRDLAAFILSGGDSDSEMFK